MRVLGISAFYHDSAAALVRDGEIVAAAQEERFSRKKHDARFPHHAIEYCLERGRRATWRIDYVVFYDKPFLKFERLLETYLAFAPRGFALVSPWRSRSGSARSCSRRSCCARSLQRFGPALRFGEDAAVRRAPSEPRRQRVLSLRPSRRPLVLTMDGVGEWATTSAALGRGNSWRSCREIHFPHSLGLFYSAFTYYTGFKVNSGEYKVMGLAPYGEPKYASLIRDHLIDLKDDGSFRLNLDYFDYCTGLAMTNGRFDELFGGPPRQPEELLTQRHMDLAASVQAVLEEIVLRMRAIAGSRDRERKPVPGRRRRAELRGQRQGARATGVFERLWIQPAAGDAGGALGAALAGLSSAQGPGRAAVNGCCDRMQGVVPRSGFRAARNRAAPAGRRSALHVVPTTRCLNACAEALDRAEGARMVSGPHGVRPARARRTLHSGRPALTLHAIGAQSEGQVSRVVPPVRARRAARGCRRLVRSRWRQPVHAAGGRRRGPRRRPHDTEPKQALRHRQAERAARAEIPAVTHVDYSARLQTVHRETNPRFHALIAAFKAAHRLPGAGQHQLQRSRRTDRMHAGRRVPLLHGNGD